MERIPSGEMQFHPQSALDDGGRPFKWRGEIYRGIFPLWTPFFRRLCDDGTISALAGKGLVVKSEIAPVSADGFDLVLRHYKIPFASYPEEWSPEMFRDAVLTIVDFWSALAERGLSLKDSHPWNVLFDGCRPVWVDLTSIVPLEKPWEEQPREELLSTGLAPLQLMAKGSFQIARALLPEDFPLKILAPLIHPVRGSLRNWARDLGTAIQRALPKRMQDFGWRVARGIGRSTAPPVRTRLLHFLRSVREDVASLRFPTTGEAPGTGVSSGVGPEIAEVVNRLNPASILDLGPERCMEWPGDCEVVRFERDAVAADRLYLKHRGSGRHLLPLVMDFVHPTPARGLADHRYLAATARFRCDGVIAIGLVAHVMLKYQRLGLAGIVDGLDRFAKRWVLLDFSLAQPGETAACSVEYSAESLRSALSRRFGKVTVVRKSAAGGELILCER